MEENHASRLTGDVIKAVASKFYDKIQIPDEERLCVLNGWLDKLKQRQYLTLQYFHREAASAPREAILPERSRVGQVISTFLSADSTRTLDDIWNADETSFFYAFSPDRGLARCPRSGLKQSRTRIKLGLAVNASGTERHKPLFIEMARMPRCFKKKLAAEHGFEYFFNKTAWMTMDIFATWLRSWNVALQQRDRQILLLLDKFSGHKIEGMKLSNIQLEFFTANLTAHVQSCDAGVIRAFKAYFRRQTVMRIIDKLMTGDVSNDLFAINQLIVMHLAKSA